MSSELPDIVGLKRAVESGQRIGPEDVSALAQTESELTGAGPIRGGTAGLSFIRTLHNHSIMLTRRKQLLRV